MAQTHSDEQLKNLLPTDYGCEPERASEAGHAAAHAT